MVRFNGLNQGFKNTIPAAKQDQVVAFFDCLKQASIKGWQNGYN